MTEPEPTRQEVLSQRRADKAPWWHSPILWAAVGAFALGLLAGAALVVPQACDCDLEHDHAEEITDEWNAGYDAGKTAREHVQ